METHTTQQEVLLFTGTGFSSRQTCEKTDPAKADQLSDRERLQDACWNGLVQEMLPELFTGQGIDRNIFLWKVTEGKSFLELDLGEFPEAKDNFFSIDPYCFLAAESLS
ncbi:MAG TPA: hypothetical protein VK644_02930 [Chitinophagaceae bacterium]|nr:hypothetical protein [Chitinophagaceae bacterium]